MTQPNPPQVGDILNAAADLLEKPGAWTQEAFSRNSDGTVDRGNGRWASKPTCFCVRGGLMAAVGIDPGTPECDPRFAAMAEAEMYLDRIIAKLGWSTSVAWNDDDERTQSDVVATLREAARLSRTQAPSR